MENKKIGKFPEKLKFSLANIFQLTLNNKKYNNHIIHLLHGKFEFDNKIQKKTISCHEQNVKTQSKGCVT